MYNQDIISVYSFSVYSELKTLLMASKMPGNNKHT